jgi:coenzyme F420-reducing hydrogenase beta subunit
VIDIQDKENCCGCEACVQICPQGCIHFEEDEEGFRYPKVDKEKCIGCNKCEKVCPILKCKEKETEDIEAFVAYILDEDIRIASSSGGIFTVLAQSILEEGGVVFGAALDGENQVNHIAVTKEKELEKLRGSKYVQSRINNTFSEVKDMLGEGKKVLFSGTACQIAGLKQYLGKEYENLLTIDVLCHGVPSPKVWEKYLKEKEKNNNGIAKQINFRNKYHGWKKFSMEIIFDNAKSYRKEFYYDYFMKLFMSNICFRKSCYACRFKDLSRPSDITLGDCWAIENYMPELNDDKGISIVLIQTSKGEKIFNQISKKIKMRQVEVEKALPPSSDSRKSVKCHSKRNEFFEKLNEGYSFRELIKLTEPSLMAKVTRKIKSMIKK